MAWPSIIPTTNVDSGADSAASARADIKTAFKAINSLINYRGSTDGFPATDSNNQQVLGTNFTAGLVSGNPTIVFDTGDKWIYNRTTNALDVYKDNSLVCSMPFATYNNVANLVGWESLAGTGLSYSGGKFNVSATNVLVHATSNSSTYNAGVWSQFNLTDVSDVSSILSGDSITFTSDTSGFYRVTACAQLYRGGEDYTKYGVRAKKISGATTTYYYSPYSIGSNDSPYIAVLDIGISFVSGDVLTFEYYDRTIQDANGNLHSFWIERKY